MLALLNYEGGGFSHLLERIITRDSIAFGGSRFEMMIILTNSEVCDALLSPWLLFIYLTYSGQCFFIYKLLILESVMGFWGVCVYL